MPKAPSVLASQVMQFTGLPIAAAPVPAYDPITPPTLRAKLASAHVSAQSAPGPASFASTGAAAVLRACFDEEATYVYGARGAHVQPSDTDAAAREEVFNHLEDLAGPQPPPRCWTGAHQTMTGDADTVVAVR